MRSRRFPALIVSLALLTLGLVAFNGVAAQGQVATCPVSTADQAVDDQERQLLTLINQYRAANGRTALGLQNDVVRAASWFSRDMAAKNYFPANHVDSNGRTVSQRLTWCGASYSSWAENIYAGRSDAQSTFDAWKASSGHNTNMLRTGVGAAGIARAYVAGSRYGWYWTLDLTNSSISAPTTTRPTTTLPSVTTTRPPVTTTPTTSAPPTTAPPVTTTPTTAPTSPTTRPPFVCPPQYAHLCDRMR